MTTNRRRSRSLTTLLSALLATSLCACDPVADVPDAEVTPMVVEPRFDPVDVPATTRPEQAVVEHPKIVGPSGDLPWYVAAVRTEPARPSTVTVWPGSGPADEPTLGDPQTLPVAGEVRSVRTATDEKTAVVVGDFWTDGTYGTYLFTSTDRATWDEVRSPELDQVDVQSVVLFGGDVVAVGVDRVDDSVRALRVTPDGAVSTFPIDLPDGAESVAGSAARGDDLVVLVTATDDSDDQSITAVRSRDGGSSWFHETVRGIEPRVSGVVALDDGFVATGTTSRELPSGTGSIATAWRVAADEDRWIATRTDDGGEPERSTGFSAPTPYQDGYAAVLWTENLLTAAFSVETSRSTGTVATTARQDYLTPSGPSAAGVDDGFLSVIAGSSGAAVVRVVEGSDTPVTIGTLAEGERWQDSALPEEAAPDRVLVRRMHLTVDDDSWSWGPRYTSLELVDGRLEARGDERGRRFVEEAPDGRSVALSLTDVGPDPQDGYHMVPSVLTESGWLTLDPVEADGFAQPYDLAWVGGRWLAAGQIAPELDDPGPDTAAVWASADGRSWEQVAGFEPGDGSSEANAVCVVGDEAFVVGQVDGERAVWTRDGGSWQHELVDLEPGEDLQDCRADGEGSLVQVGTDEGTELRRTEDGLTYETVHVPEPDQFFGSVGVVDGGFAAPGFVKTEEWEGPVLWLSADAEDWWWTPIPTDHVGWGEVYPVEDGLVVTIDAPGGMQAWHVPGVAEVITSHDAGS